MLLWKLLLFNFFTFSIGLVSTSGHLWKQQRTFTLNALRHFGFGKRSIESKIVEEAGFFVEVLEKNKGLPVCNEDSIREAISNVTCSIVFGKRFSYDDKTFLTLIQNIEDILSNPFVPIVNWIPFLHNFSDLFFDVFGTRKCITEVKELKDHFAKIIQVHKETLDENDARDFIDAYLIEWQKHTQEEDNTQFTGKYKTKSSKVRQSAVRTPFMARCSRYNIM